MYIHLGLMKIYEKTMLKMKNKMKNKMNKE